MKKLSSTIFVFICLASATFGQVCDYEISPSTHHNWVDVVAGVVSPCAGAGCDSTIIRGSQKLKIGAEDYGGGQEIAWRSYIKFDLPFNRVNSCIPKNAYLNLNFTGNSVDSHKTDSGSNSFVIRRIIEPWGDDSLRWETLPPSSQHRIPKTTDQNEVVVAGTSVGDEDFKIYIQRFINFWRSYPDSNFGIEVRLQTESALRSLNFASADHPNPSIRPSVEFQFNDCNKNRAYAGPDVEICQGQSVELQGQYSEFFRWENNSTLSNLYISNPTASPFQDTFYVLETTLGSCKSTDTVRVTVHDYPTLSVSSNVSICEGDSTQLSATTNALNLSWSPSTNITSTTDSDPFVFPKATQLYSVTVDNGNKCSVTKDVNVTVKKLPATDAGTNVSVCPGGSIVLLAKGADSYQWDPLPGLSNLNSPTPTAAPSVSTTYRVVGTRNGCSTFDTVRVEVHPDFTLDAGADQELCSGDTVLLKGSDGFKNYEWRSTDPLKPVTFSNAFVKDPFIIDLDEDRTLSLVAYDINNCKKEDQLDLVVHENPQLDAGKDTFVCFGAELELNPIQVVGQGTIQYRWTNTLGMDPNDATIRQPTIKGITSGVFYYGLIITDENGCEAEDSVKISMLERPQFEILADKDTVCQGVPVTLRGKGSGSYEWFPEEYIVGTNIGQRVTIIPPVEPVQFKFYGNTFAPCGEDTSDAISVNVIELPRPKIGVFENGELKDVESEKACKGDSVILKAEGADEYHWIELNDSSDEVAIHLLSSGIKHTVVGFRSGCRGYMDTVELSVDPADSCSSKIWPPNIFIPKGAISDSNKYFYVKGYKIKDYNVQIFDRWGTKMFESSDIDDHWDGTFRGKLVPQGAYYYVITAFGEDEEVRNRNGTVTIIY